MRRGQRGSAGRGRAGNRNARPRGHRRHAGDARTARGPQRRFVASPDQSQIRRLPHDDFLRLKETLTEMGISLHEEETAEQRLADLRDQYEPYVIALAKYLQMPLSGWLAEDNTLDDWQTSAWKHLKT